MSKDCVEHVRQQNITDTVVIIRYIAFAAVLVHSDSVSEYLK